MKRILKQGLLSREDFEQEYKKPAEKHYRDIPELRRQINTK